MDNGNVLESWKEVASHLSRNIRTCQMWERGHGLPITKRNSTPTGLPHRLDGYPKARVFAYKDELDSWLEEKLREREAESPPPKGRTGTPPRRTSSTSPRGPRRRP